MSNQCTFTMEVISLVQRGNWGRIMKNCMIIKYSLLCQSMVEIGLGGIRILHLQATWVLYGRGKSDQWEQYYNHYWKHMGKVWMMSFSLQSWQKWKVYWTPYPLQLKQLMILQVFNNFLLLTFWPWNQRLFHCLQGSSWRLMFIARDAGNMCNILVTNFVLAGEKSIYSHFKNVKNGQAEVETLGYIILFC